MSEIGQRLEWTSIVIRAQSGGPDVRGLIEDGFIGAGDPIAEPVVTHQLPEGLDEFQFGRAHRAGEVGLLSCIAPFRSYA